MTKFCSITKTLGVFCISVLICLCGCVCVCVFIYAYIKYIK